MFDVVYLSSGSAVKRPIKITLFIQINLHTYRVYINPFLFLFIASDDQVFQDAFGNLINTLQFGRELGCCREMQQCVIPFLLVVNFISNVSFPIRLSFSSWHDASITSFTLPIISWIFSSSSKVLITKMDSYLFIDSFTSFWTMAPFRSKDLRQQC